MPTLKDLLSMSSGIQDYKRYDECADDCETTKMLPKRIEEINPGKYRYSLASREVD